jgi:hypothetical protein
MKIYLATWLLEPQQGKALTKRKAKHRLISYFHTTAKADQLIKYVKKGLNK